MYAIYHPAWVFVLLILMSGQPRPRCWISKCSACAFLWTYPEIRTCSIESWWHSSLLVMHHSSRSNSLPAGHKKIAQTDKIVISGFHSPIERVVLDILLAHRCSFVVTLGRSLYSKIPAHLQAAYDGNRLLLCRSATIPVTHIATPRSVTGQQPISPTNSSSLHSTTWANSQLCILPTQLAQLPVLFCSRFQKWFSFLLSRKK